VPAYPVHREFKAVLIATFGHKVLVQLSKPRSDGSRDTSASDDGTIGLTFLAGVGAEVVGASGLQARPLGGGTSIGTGIFLAFKTLWPAGR
jgi:hypothetical protein